MTSRETAQPSSSETVSKPEVSSSKVETCDVNVDRMTNDDVTESSSGDVTKSHPDDVRETEDAESCPTPKRRRTSFIPVLQTPTRQKLPKPLSKSTSSHSINLVKTPAPHSPLPLSPLIGGKENTFVRSCSARRRPTAPPSILDNPTSATSVRVQAEISAARRSLRGSGTPGATRGASPGGSVKFPRAIHGRTPSERVEKWEGREESSSSVNRTCSSRNRDVFETGRVKRKIDF